MATKQLELKRPRLFVVGHAKAGRVVVVDINAWRKQRAERVGRESVDRPGAA